MEKKTIGTKMYGKLGRLLLIAATGSLVFSSCEDKYIYDDKEPEWLGSSIYNELQQRGNFKNYLRIIDDCGEKQTLSLTGSKTLFVADDEAFERFFNSANDWNIKSYEDLSQVQKNLILKFSMVNNAYLIETLSNYNSGGLQEGAAMRRTTAVSMMDTVRYMAPSQIPQKKYWANSYRNQKGLYIWEDHTDWTMVYFLQKQLSRASITNDDVEVILGVSREYDDAHIFDKKVVERDITCKNGYLNILSDVLIPPANMAQHINKTATTSIFSDQLDRFALPMYYSSLNDDYKELNTEFTDSIFVKRYMAANGGVQMYPNGSAVDESLYLPFDPGWNSYKHNVSGYALQSDMAAMFVPSDKAMNEYFNVGNSDLSSGGSKSAGALLMERFGHIDSIPDNIMVKLVKRHMIPSFVNSVPSKFSKLIDTENSEFPVTKDDIESSYIGTNGIVYHVNKVFPPDIYSSVVAPVLFSDQTTIMNKAIEDYGFQLYLNSMAMDGMEGYSLLVPTDEYMQNYIDPLTYGCERVSPTSLKFVIDTINNSYYYLSAIVYKFDKETNQVGDSITKIMGNTTAGKAFIENRITDILDSHIIVADIRKGGYYLTKGGQMVYVKGEGSNMTIQGGGDILNNQEIKVVTEKGERYEFDQANGVTLFTDKPIDTPKRSVYSILKDDKGEYKNAFDLFFELCEGFPNKEVFLNDAKKSGIDYNIKFFNTFNYTVYAPTNAALEKAIFDEKITPWQDMEITIGGVTKQITGIESLQNEGSTEATEKANQLIKKLERFVRYHFQDESVFIDPTLSYASQTFQTATIKEDDIPSMHNTYKNKYYKIAVQSVSDGNGGTTLELTSESIKGGTAGNWTAGKAKVLKSYEGVNTYNILTRDYIFNTTPASITTISNSGTYATSTITTSSVAVIHLIDNVLYFENEINVEN